MIPARRVAFTGYQCHRRCTHALLHFEHVCDVSPHCWLCTKASSVKELSQACWILRRLAMASLVDAPSMAVDPAEPARASTTPPSKSQKKREQRRRAAERKRAADVPDAAAAGASTAGDGAGHSARDSAGDSAGRRRYRETRPHKRRSSPRADRGDGRRRPRKIWPRSIRTHHRRTRSRPPCRPPARDGSSCRAGVATTRWRANCKRQKARARPSASSRRKWKG